MTNDKYRSQKLALVQKVPTPIKPITIDQTTRHITLAYFEQKSTVDYIGVVQGIPICFDAKECATDRFPLANVHEHQIRFMKEFEEQDGIAFLFVASTVLFPRERKENVPGLCEVALCVDALYLFGSIGRGTDRYADCTLHAFDVS